LCNIVSILSAFAFIYAFTFSIVAELPSPALVATVVGISVLVLLELLQRALVPEFFKGILQIWFSYSGSFDTVEQLTEAPKKEKVKLYNISKVSSEYNLKILKAQKIADDFIKAHPYHITKHSKLLARVDWLEKQKSKEVQRKEAKNEKLENEAKANFTTALLDYETTNKTKGFGLGKLTVFTQIIFFVCLFFLELFDYKTFTQYADLETGNTPVNNGGNRETVRETITPKTLKIDSKGNSRNKIGFSQKQQFQTGVKTIQYKGKHLTLKDVNNRINIYKNRLEESEKEGRRETAERRAEVLEFWEIKKIELS